jgi:parallel beta-helix repeat protein
MKKKSVILFSLITLLLFITLIGLFIIRFVEASTPISACGTLNVTNSTYILTSNVTSIGTCFTISVANITLDCDGYWVIYSTGGAANTRGIYTNQFNTTIKNCNILDGNRIGVAGSRYGIYFNGADNSTIFNTFVNATNSYGAYISSTANFNNFTSNNFRTNSGASIRLNSASYNYLENNLFASTSGEGIYLISSSNNILINNNISTSSNCAMDISSSRDNILINNKVTSSSNGIHFISSSNNLLINNTGTSTGSSPGILFTGASNNTLINNTGISNSGNGIYLSSSSNNNILINNAAITNTNYAISLVSSSNNTFTNQIIKELLTGKGISIRASNNTIFRDWVMDVSSDALSIYYYTDSGSVNNTFINCSYPTGKELVQGTGNELIRKWYYQAHVDDSLGKSIQGADVSAYNALNVQQFTKSTDSSGWVGRQEIIDYINTAGTRTYYSNYTINATSTTEYSTESNIFNFTIIKNKIDDFFTLILLDINCTDTCASLGYECGTVCGIDCGTCLLANAVSQCDATHMCAISSCNTGYANCDLIPSNGCETQLGTPTNCGYCGNACSIGQICSAGICVTPCIDTCSSLGYNCGIQSICGSNINCGTCSTGYNCNSTGQCIACIPNCNGKECGSDGCSGNCGTCSIGQVCSGGVCTTLQNTGEPIWCAFHAIHTSYSDGAMNLTQSVNSLKSYYNCGSTNDHDSMLDQTEWTSMIDISNAENVDNNFTYFFGTEWTSSQHIHYITMNPSPTQKDKGDSDFNTVSELAAWLSTNSGIAQHNHPARTSGGTDFSNPANYNETWIPLVEFKNSVDWHWNYYWDCATGSGCTTYQNPHTISGQTAGSTGWIKYALDKGIHLGFSCGNDDHSALPFTPTCYTGVSNAENLTRQGVYNALKSRHTWASEQKTWMNIKTNNGLEDFTMGDIFNTSSPSVTIIYSVNATPGNTISNISLFYNGIIVNVTDYSQQNITGSITQTLTPNEEDYLFIEAIQSNGKRAWSSPIWVTSTANNPCTDTCSSLGYNCGTQTICGISTACGTCSTGYTCQLNGTCIEDIPADITPPVITINSPFNQTYTKKPIVMNVTATDNSGVSSCVYSLDGKVNITMVKNIGDYWTAVDSSISRGGHNVIFYCTDVSGLVSSKQEFFTFNKAASQVSLSYIVTPNCSVVSGEGTPVLLVNGEIAVLGTSYDISAGNYTFNCSLAESEEYDYSEKISNVLIFSI